MSNELALAASPTMPPIEVDATPIMVDLTAQREWVEAVRDLYLEADVSALTLADAKRERASLNAFGKQLGDFRREAKRRNEARVAGLLDQLKAMESAIGEASSVVDARAKDLEARELEARTARLRGAYEEFAPALVPVVPFERLASGEKWLNKSYGEKNAIADMQSKVSGIARAWDMLKSDGLDPDALKVAERTLFETLSYERARREADAYRAERERIDAMRALVEPEPPRPAPTPAPAPRAAEQPAPRVQPTPMRQDEPRGPWVVELLDLTPEEAREVYELAFEMYGRERVRLHEGTLFGAALKNGR